MFPSRTRVLEEKVIHFPGPKVSPLELFSTYGGLQRKIPTEQQSNNFIIRFSCMQSRFLRCSYQYKIKLLTLLFDKLNSIESLSLILKTLVSTSRKSTIYSESQYYTNFIYDKALNDHNRSLNEETLVEAQNSDIAWFSTLQNDYEQILICTGLIKLAGGSVTHNVFKEGVKQYKLRLDGIDKDKQTEEFVVSLSTVADKATSLSIKPDKIDKTELASTDPVVLEMEALKKSWKKAIEKYRKKVEGQKNPSKKEKSPKPKKNAKKSENEELDRIQLLPIWLVKKIFGYLDKKTLKKAKKVSKYWSYVVGELKKEGKTRKSLNKTAKKLKKSIRDEMNISHKSDKKIRVDELRPKLRLRKLFQRGAVKRNLLENFDDNLWQENMLIQNTPYVGCIFPIQEMESFPRKCDKGSFIYQIQTKKIDANGITQIHFDNIYGEIFETRGDEN